MKRLGEEAGNAQEDEAPQAHGGMADEVEQNIGSLPVVRRGTAFALLFLVSQPHERRLLTWDKP